MLEEQGARRQQPRFRPRLEQNQDRKILMLDQLKQEARFKELGGNFRSQSNVSQTLPQLEAPRTAILGREVDREIVQLELNQRVRELETVIIDFKANMERRIAKTIEENPQKFMTIFRQLEDKEMQLWKQNFDKHQMSSEIIIQMKETHRRQIENLTTMILEVQRKVDGTDFQVSRIQKQSEAFQLQIQAIVSGQQNQRALSNENSQVPDYEVKLLREAFHQEKANRDQVIEDLSRFNQDLNQKILKQEQEFYLRLKNQRDELIEQNQITKNQMKGLDQLKLQQINKDQDYIRQLVGSVDQRIADEVEKRLRNDFEGKNQLEQKLHQFREEIRNDEKQILQGEQRFMQQMHESISSLNSIFKNTKEQLEAQMAATQTLTTENIKTLTRTLDAVREGTSTKLGLIEQSQRELNFRVSESRQMMHDHASLMNETIQQEMQKITQQLDDYEKKIDIQMIAHSENMSLLKKDNEDWRQTTEKKNLIIFTEVTNALKSLKKEFGQDRKDNAERQDSLRKEVALNKQTQETLLLNLENHLKQIEVQTDFKLNEQKVELKELTGNIKLQLQLKIDEIKSETLTQAQTYTNEKLTLLDVRLSSTIQSKYDELRLHVDEQIDQSELRMTEYVDDREKIIKTYVQELFKKEKEEREKLLKLIEEFSASLNGLRDEINKKLNTLKEYCDKQLIDGLNNLESRVNDALSEQRRQIDLEIQEIENKLNLKLTDISDRLKKQLDQLKEYFDQQEKAMKSYLEQKLDEVRFELKAEMKQLENDLFKLKVWVMKQVEMMNQAMQDIHLQIQTEMFMDRTMNALMIEQFVGHVEGVLEVFDKQRQAWQDHILDQFNGLKSEIQTSFERIESDLKNAKETLQQQLDETNKRLNDTISEMKEAFEKQVEELKQNVQKQIEELDQRTQNQLKLLEKDINEAMQTLGFEVGESLQELKGQLDQVYTYFEGKFYMEAVLKRAAQQIENEKAAGLIGKVNKIITEMERLEKKTNDTNKTLNDFTQTAAQNFITLQDATKAHISFLNELDAQITSNDFATRIAMADLEESVKQIYESTKKGFEATNYELELMMKEIEETLNRLNKESQEEMKKLLKQLDVQKKELQGKIQLQGVMIAAVETSLLAKQKDGFKQTWGMISDNQRLNNQNLITMEGNVQRVMENELNKINDWIKEFSEQIQDVLQNSDTEVDDLRDKQTKLIGDINSLTAELEEHFKKIENNILILDTNQEKNLKTLEDKLQIQIDQAERDIQTIQPRLQQVEGAVSLVQGEGLKGLDARLDALEGENGVKGLDRRLDLVEGEKGLKGLDARIDILEGDQGYKGLDARIDTLEGLKGFKGIDQRVVVLEGEKGVKGLDARLDLIEEKNLKGLESRLDVVEGLNGVKGLDNRLDVLEGEKGFKGLQQQLDILQKGFEDNQQKLEDAQKEVDALQGKVKSVDSNVQNSDKSQAERIKQLEEETKEITEKIIPTQVKRIDRLENQSQEQANKKEQKALTKEQLKQQESAPQNKDIVSLQTNQRETERQLTDVKASVEHHGVAIDDLTKQLDVEIKKIYAQIQMLQKQTPKNQDNDKQGGSPQSQELRKVEDDLRILSKEVDQLEKELKTQKALNVDQEAKIKQIESALLKSSDGGGGVGSQLVEKKISDLMEEIDQLTEEVNSHSERLSKLEGA